MKYIVSALMSQALETKEIEAGSVEQAKEIYYTMWQNGEVEALDAEFDRYTITDPSGKDHVES
jgi:hypothetical protein